MELSLASLLAFALEKIWIHTLLFLIILAAEGLRIMRHARKSIDTAEQCIQLIYNFIDSLQYLRANSFPHIV